MAAAKQLKIDDCREDLKKHGINFVEHKNGHFRIFKKGSTELLVEIWATTEKYNVPEQGYARGLAAAGKIIKQHYNL